ncbi:MAG: T9SS type A sorting domain-containing protein [Flavobacteriales bacterium]|nr:T9SS type A sorting domain-containing protein [Flavobacteriales bacterium]
MAGQQVTQKTFTNGQAKLNVREAVGIYIVKINSGGKITNHKVHIN